jgi:AraC-like DNA-binding protein
MQQSAASTAARNGDAGPRGDAFGHHAFFQPRPPLDQLIDFFWVSETNPAQAPRERVLPCGALALIINLGADRFDIYAHDDAPEPLDVGSAILCGGRARPVVIGTAVLRSTIGVHFRPGGVRPFFDVPAGALEEHVVPLEAVWGAAGRTLRARLLDATSHAARVRILEDVLLERARGCLAVPALLRATLAAFEDQDLASVADVRDRFGLSAKRLLQLFHDEVGLSPKAYWRVRRFRAALAHLDRGTMNGATLAAALGYADQAHFIREFRAISGGSPREYLSRRVGAGEHVRIDRDMLSA